MGADAPSIRSCSSITRATERRSVPPAPSAALVAVRSAATADAGLRHGRSPPRGLPLVVNSSLTGAGAGMVRSALQQRRLESEHLAVISRVSSRKTAGTSRMRSNKAAKPHGAGGAPAARRKISMIFRASLFFLCAGKNDFALAGGVGGGVGGGVAAFGGAVPRLFFLVSARATRPLDARKSRAGERRAGCRRCRRGGRGPRRRLGRLGGAAAGARGGAGRIAGAERGLGGPIFHVMEFSRGLCVTMRASERHLGMVLF